VIGSGGIIFILDIWEEDWMGSKEFFGVRYGHSFKEMSKHDELFGWLGWEIRWCVKRLKK